MASRSVDAIEVAVINNKRTINRDDSTIDKLEEACDSEVPVYHQPKQSAAEEIATSLSHTDRSPITTAADTRIDINVNEASSSGVDTRIYVNADEADPSTSRAGRSPEELEEAYNKIMFLHPLAELVAASISNQAGERRKKVMYKRFKLYCLAWALPVAFCLSVIGLGVAFFLWKTNEIGPTNIPICNRQFRWFVLLAVGSPIMLVTLRIIFYLCCLCKDPCYWMLQERLTAGLDEWEHCKTDLDFVSKELKEMAKDDDPVDIILRGSASDRFGFFWLQGTDLVPSVKRWLIGCCSCRRKKDKDVLCSILQDTDFDISLKRMEMGQENLLKVDGKHGFVQIKVSKEQAERLQDPILWKSLVKTSEDNGEGYLISRKAMIDTISGRVKKAGDIYAVKNENDKANKDSNGCCYPRQVPESSIKVKLNSPAVVVIKEKMGPTGKQKFHFDFVGAIPCRDWPEDAAEWRDRERKRSIPASVIDEITTAGCLVVPRGYLDDDEPGAKDRTNRDDSAANSEMADENSANDSAWRLTFSEAEKRLFSHHEELTALVLCYIVLKYIIKAGKKDLPIEAKSLLRSYFLKTIFLTLAEQGVLGSDLTGKGKKACADAGRLFLEVLDRLKSGLKSGELRHYFVHQRNLLDSIKDESTMSKKEKKGKEKAIDLLDCVSRYPALCICWEYWFSFTEGRWKLAYVIITGFLFFLLAGGTTAILIFLWYKIKECDMLEDQSHANIITSN